MGRRRVADAPGPSGVPSEALDRGTWGKIREWHQGRRFHDGTARMSSEEQHEEIEAAALRRNRQSNRRVLIIIGLMTLLVIGWNLYAQLVRG